MYKNRLIKSILGLSTLVLLAACSIDQDGDVDSESVGNISSDIESIASTSNMGEMMHDDSEIGRAHV